MPVEEVGPVVVGVDGSTSSLAAVDLAVAEAAARRRSLMLLHVRGGPRPAAGMTPVPADARRLLETAAARSGKAALPIVPVTAELAWGEPGDVLAAVSAHACLVVVGHRTRCAGAGRPRASVAGRLARTVGCPLLVCRSTVAPGGVSPSGPVLLGLPAGGAEAAVAFAFAEAAMRAAPLAVVHVWSRPEDCGPVGVHLGPAGLMRARAAAGQLLVEAVERWAEKYPEVVVRRAVRHSLDVPVALLAASRGAQLVVVGSARGAGERSGVVVPALVHRAGCPVAVVPVE